MGKFTDRIHPQHRQFIEDQHLFFTGTAPLAPDGHVNLSPKGGDAFRVLGEREVGYMDLIGSGNETSAHLLENGRITFMWCSFGKVPNILRLYGQGRTVLPESPEWERYASQFEVFPSTRQLIIADIDLVQTSCGYGVPEYSFKGDRDIHFRWAEKKGTDGLSDYITEKNAESLDGLPTDTGRRDAARPTAPPPPTSASAPPSGRA